MHYDFASLMVCIKIFKSFTLSMEVMSTLFIKIIFTTKNKKKVDLVSSN